MKHHYLAVFWNFSDWNSLPLISNHRWEVLRPNIKRAIYISIVQGFKLFKYIYKKIKTSNRPYLLPLNSIKLAIKVFTRFKDYANWYTIRFKFALS
jgi:hypothetical protein